MGKVLRKIEEIRSKPTYELLKRFMHIVGAKAIREYLASKPDQQLNVEVRLTEEELMQRIPSVRPNDKKQKPAKIIT